MNLQHPIRLTDPAYKQQAHDIFRWMRQERPVYEAKISRWKSAYLITRYADVEAALKDPRLVKDPKNASSHQKGNGAFWVPKAFRPLMENMLNTDEPDHRRLRNLVHKGFTPRRIEELAPQIEAIAQDLIAKAKKKGEFDLIESFALPLPVAVIAQMLGIPDEDLPHFKRFAEGILVNPTPINMMLAVPPIMRFVQYIRQLADKRRRNPKDDLISALAQAEDEEGDRFTEDELIGMVFLLFVAGHETTVNLITNGTLALLQNRDQFELLKERPDHIETAVEEMLRYDGPLEMAEMSFAREELTLHGVTIPEGAVVLPTLISANRDSEMFTDPDQLDITRSPNKHLAFGKGIHYCLGAPLARLEAKTAFCTLLREAPDLQLAIPAEQLRYSSMMLVHRLERLPVTV